ncbi:STE24 endopeptidase [Haloactinopolyspora alba]|uniref:STE24 endopeptidase n=1 Tax=Haloactinopolyspora alba TaxID=648780 RepID=A0A2P8EB89_9ACTN|nr:M48 family metalloprotease [Haloactinopolyspora alba]PSL06732.1 STE24 endopeptidase [Haloactinopolyspora alba]
MSDPEQAGASRPGSPAGRVRSHVAPSGPPGSFEQPEPAGSGAPPTAEPGQLDPPGRSAEPGRLRLPRPAWRRARETASAPVSDPARRRRTVDVSTVASLALAVPWFLYSLLVMGFVGLAAGALAGDVAAISIAVVVAWLLSGALIFAQPVEVFLARTVLRARRPTPAERERLEHAWRDVGVAGGTDGAGYRLFVQDSDALNAYAASGHIVTVTRKALDAMPHHHLAAVLAHELGHHLGGHAWGNLLAYWYSLPARLLNRLLRFLVRAFVRVFSFVFAVAARAPGLVVVVAHVITWTFAAFALFLLVMLMVAAARDGQLWVPPVVVVMILSPLLLAWLARRSEFGADRVAAQLGYGPALIEVFEDWLRQGMDDERTHAVLRARLFSTHPALAARIKKLDAYLRKTG